MKIRKEKKKECKTAVSILGLDVKNEEYLAKIFELLKYRESLVITDKKTYFNNTELRMLGEIIAAKYAGERLISTQLARLLGITRSAVSQIVNRLEERGIVKRVPDEVDRKIAYIELSADIIAQYGEDVKTILEFLGGLVEEFGEDNFNKMCDLFAQFTTLAQRRHEQTVLAEKEAKKRAKKKAAYREPEQLTFIEDM